MIFFNSQLHDTSAGKLQFSLQDEKNVGQTRSLTSILKLLIVEKTYWLLRGGGCKVSIFRQRGGERNPFKNSKFKISESKFHSRLLTLHFVQGTVPEICNFDVDMKSMSAES